LQVGADRFNKPGYWDVSHGIPVLTDRDAARPKPGIGGILPPPWAPVKCGPDYSVFPGGHGSKAPTWLAFDKQVCP